MLCDVSLTTMRYSPRVYLFIGYASVSTYVMRRPCCLEIEQVSHNNRAKFPKDFFAIALFTNMTARTSCENTSFIVSSRSARMHEARTSKEILSYLWNNEQRNVELSNWIWFSVSPQQFLTTAMTHIGIDKRTDNANPHSIDSLLQQYQRQRKCVCWRRHCVTHCGCQDSYR